MKKNKNANLHRAKSGKNDEFYTQLNDRTAEDEAEVAVREENKYKKIPTSLGFEDRLVSDT